MSITKKSIAAGFILIIFASSLAGESGARRSWRYYFKKGMLQFNAEMHDYAILNFVKALELNPKLYEAANRLADIYRMKNKNLQSIDYLEQSLNINDRQPDTHNKIALLYEFFAEYEKAFLHFKRTVELEPGHIEGNINLVRYYIRSGEGGLADRRFKISYDAGKRKCGKYFTEAADAEEKGETERALSLYRRCIDESPAMMEAYGRVFEIHRSRKDFLKAADVMKRLVFLKPDYEKGYVNLGHLYFSDPLPGKRIFNLNEAAKNFEKALELNPSNMDTYQTLAYIYRYMGKTDRAEMIEKKAEEASEDK